MHKFVQSTLEEVTGIYRRRRISNHAANHVFIDASLYAVLCVRQSALFDAVSSSFRRAVTSPRQHGVVLSHALMSIYTRVAAKTQRVAIFIDL